MYEKAESTFSLHQTSLFNLCQSGRKKKNTSAHLICHIHLYRGYFDISVRLVISCLVAFPASSSMGLCPASPFLDPLRQNQARPLRAHLKLHPHLSACGAAGGAQGLSSRTCVWSGGGFLRDVTCFYSVFKLCPPGGAAPGLSTHDMF